MFTKSKKYLLFGTTLLKTMKNIKLFVQGELTTLRARRKCQQIENLVHGVRKVCTRGDTIVEFCCGGGRCSELGDKYKATCYTGVQITLIEIVVYLLLINLLIKNMLD